MNTLLCSSPLYLFQPLQPLSPPKYSNYGDIRGIFAPAVGVTVLWYGWVKR